MHSPPTIVRHIVRPKSAEPPRSPLLKRVQSEEKLSPAYGGDKKHLCSRKHSLEVTQEEVPREQVPREASVQSVEENICDAPSLSRARPVEQGCLKRPAARKLGRQESVDDLDRDKLKGKVVAKKPEGLLEKHEIQHPKVHGTSGDSENLPTFRLEDREKVYAKAPERPSPFESKPVLQEATSLGSLLKDALHKQASARASEGAASDRPVPPEHSQASGDFKRPSTPGPLPDSLSPSTDRTTSRKVGDSSEKGSQAKECPRCEKLDSRLASLDYLRKMMSLEDKEDSLCPGLKPKVACGTHEGLSGSSVWPVGAQQESLTASEGRAFMASAHGAQVGTGSFVPLKSLSGRADGGAEKPGLIPPESPIRKSPSEYKLEGRSMSCLKPIEGTLDIALLSGPQTCKAELSSPESTLSPCPGSELDPLGFPALPSSGGKKGEASSQREPPSSNFKVTKSVLLEPRFAPTSRSLQVSPAAALPEAESRRDKRGPQASRTPALFAESPAPCREASSFPTQNQYMAGDLARARGSLSTTGVPLREKGGPRDSSEGGLSTPRSEGPVMRTVGHREVSTDLSPPDTARANDSSRNNISMGRAHPQESLTERQAMGKTCGPGGKAHPKESIKEMRPLAREESAGAPGEHALDKGRSGLDPRLDASSTASRSLQAPVSGASKSEKLIGDPSLPKDSPKEPERKEQPFPKQVSSGSQPPHTITKEPPSQAVRPPCSTPSLSAPGRELSNSPSTAEPSPGLLHPPKPTAVHGASSSHKPRPGPDVGPPKSKHSDRPISSQKLGAVAMGAREPGTPSRAVSATPSREVKDSSKGVQDAFPAIPVSHKATGAASQGGIGSPLAQLSEAGTLDAKLKPTMGGRPLEALEKQLPKPGHSAGSESTDPAVAVASEKHTLSPKHPKPSTVKDGTSLCRQMDRSPSPQTAVTTDRKSEGKRGTEALYVTADGGRLEANLPLTQGETRLLGVERPPMAGSKAFPETRGKGLGPQKPLTEAAKPGSLKRSPSATGQSSLKSAALPEKSLSCSSSFAEARAGTGEASAANTDPSSAKAHRAESSVLGPREPRKCLPGVEGRTQMTKSDSLPSFRSSISLEPPQCSPAVSSGAAGHRDRALSVTATPGDTKGKDIIPTQSLQLRKQNTGREGAKPGPAHTPSTERPFSLSSEKDFVVRQRRGKDSLRSSPHKKTS